MLRKGFTLIELLIVIALLAALSGAGALLLGSGCGYSEDVEGRIAFEPGARMKATKTSAQQKIAITLDPVSASSSILKAGGGPSDFGDGEQVTLECLSTRCAQVQVDQCHSFACKVSWRAWEPNVVVCKHDRKIKCGDKFRVPDPASSPYGP